MQQNPANLNHVNQYARYAIGAVRAEREGRYADAATLWLKAAQAPCRAVNQGWAKERRKFCLHAESRVWSNPNAG
ncbi:ANR family transcriptional regulator [Pantoea sp. Eser]|nr:ANR family transcriptional regulator [Pantoea sp. Eser]